VVGRGAFAVSAASLDDIFPPDFLHPFLETFTFCVVPVLAILALQSLHLLSYNNPTLLTLININIHVLVI